MTILEFQLFFLACMVLGVVLAAVAYRIYPRLRWALSTGIPLAGLVMIVTGLLIKALAGPGGK